MIFKKIKQLLIISILTSIFLVASPASAQPDIGIGSGGMAQKVSEGAGFDTNQDELTLSKTIGGIIRGILSLIGVIFLVLTVYAGILWMTASGSEDKIIKAKGILTSSVIGLLVVVAAYGITALVMNFIVGAQEPSTNTDSYPGSELKIGCCYSKSRNLCAQTASNQSCVTKWSDGFWTSGESCTPYITRNTGCSIDFTW